MRSIALLSGARVQRIDAPSEDALSITLAGQSYKGVLVASLREGARGVGLVAKRPKGAPATSFVQKLRKELAGGRLAALVQSAAHVVELRVARPDGERRLVFELGAHPDILLLDAGGKPLASLRRRGNDASAERPPARHGTLFWSEDIDELEAHGAELLTDQAAVEVAARRRALLREVAAVHKRLSRRHAAVQGDVARAADSMTLRAQATLVLANLHAIPRGAREVRLQDFACDPPALIPVHLDPALPARAQAEAWFAKARRFDRGAQLAKERLALTACELDKVQALRAQIESAETPALLDELAERARRLGARLQQAAAAKPGRKAEPTRTPYRELRGFQDRPILVGRGAADNDALTLLHARPHDLWLHARDVTGAHVIVPLARGEACPPELLRDAAILAAHFSDVRGEPVVDVVYVPRRYVHKRRGAAQGALSVEREKVMRLQVEPKALERLLASELRT